ncbi:MAG: TetR/AcrR family transcriptional regulator [Pyrinomonadaceae bacterium]
MIRPAEIEKSEAGRQALAAGGRMAGEDRRRQLVLVAMRLFSQQGFSRTTTKEIAQAAGVSEATLFKHFATKEDLYAAILDHKACEGEMPSACPKVSEAIARGDNRAVFEGLARALLQFHEADPDFARLLIRSALQGHELFQMFWEKSVRRTAEFLRDYLRQQQEVGTVRPDLNPMVIARAFSGMVVNHSFVNILFEPQRRLLNISNEQAACDFTEILLRGVATEAAAKLAPAPRARKSAARPRNKKK